MQIKYYILETYFDPKNIATFKTIEAENVPAMIQDFVIFRGDLLKTTKQWEKALK